MVVRHLQLLLLFVLAVAMPGCREDDEQRFVRAFTEAVEARRDGHASGSVQLPRLTEFAWDRVWFFPSETPLDAIERRLGVDWEDAPSSEQSGDTIVIFTRNAAPVGGYVLPQSVDNVTFCLELQSPLSARAASFVLRPDPSGAHSYLISHDLATGRYRPRIDDPCLDQSAGSR